MKKGTQKGESVRILKWFALGVVFCCVSVIALVKEQPSENWEQEAATIDQTVENLIDLRNKELANAVWAQNQGDRLQFQSNNLMDARRYWNEADTSREIAARYQEEIDKLELRKQELLKTHRQPPKHET